MAFEKPVSPPSTEPRTKAGQAARPGSGQGWDFSNCAMIVAHPDDETLWAGGLMLLHPESRWTVMTICRKSDADRAARFQRVMQY
jgi:hypothetical protein